LLGLKRGVAGDGLQGVPNVRVEATMAKEEESGAGSILLAFILGAVSGAALALLYAPATGRETREYLGEKAREGRDRANKAAERGRDIINQGRETLTTAIDRGREAYQQARARENA
jgi:gas vesicle protein